MIAGTYVHIGVSQRAFVPALLPPKIDLDLDVINALSAADRAVGAMKQSGARSRASESAARSPIESGSSSRWS